MKALYRNWLIHNLIGHPLSEIAYWVCRLFGKAIADKVRSSIHNATLPEILDESD